MSDLIGFCNSVRGVASGNGQIYEVPPDASVAPVNITADASRDYQWVEWSPDMTKFLAAEDIGPSLSIVDPASGSIITDLTATATLSNAPFCKGAWAPDGSMVYVPGADDPDGRHVDIQVVQTDNSGYSILPVVFNEQDVANPNLCLSPDGSKLAFSTLRSDQLPGDTYNDLTVCNADGSSPSILLHGNTTSQAVALPIQWYADSVNLLCVVLVTGAGDTQLWKVDTSAGTHTVLFDDPTEAQISYSGLYTMSPDETRVMATNPNTTSLIVITFATAAVDTIYTITGGIFMQGMSWGDYTPPPPPPPAIATGDQATGVILL